MRRTCLRHERELAAIALSDYIQRDDTAIQIATNVKSHSPHAMNKLDRHRKRFYYVAYYNNTNTDITYRYR
jgi:hypothetical protein